MHLVLSILHERILLDTLSRPTDRFPLASALCAKVNCGPVGKSIRNRRNHRHRWVDLKSY